MRLARWVFGIAGIWGTISLVPDYFMEGRIAREYPPAITHPEFYYGFIGVALVWQFGFFLIASDPKRFRPFMWLGIGEKLSFVLAAMALYAQGRLPQILLPFAVLDLAFAGAFFWAWIAVGKRELAVSGAELAAGGKQPATSHTLTASR